MTDTDGTYQIWQQKRGLAPQHVITLYDRRDARNFLRYLADKESGEGVDVSEDKAWGFSANLINRHGTNFHTCAYWCEQVMTDEGINEERVKIFAPIKNAMAKAMILGALDGKARRDAVAYGEPLERSEGE